MLYNCSSIIIYEEFRLEYIKLWRGGGKGGGGWVKERGTGGRGEGTEERGREGE